MNLYHLWFNLQPGVKDLAITDALHAYLGYLRERGHIHSYRITRRKFGFAPRELGDWHVMIECDDLAQLDSAFNLVAAREHEVEKLHAAVYGSVCNVASALYRDFPDPQRKR